MFMFHIDQFLYIYEQSRLQYVLYRAKCKTIAGMNQKVSVPYKQYTTQNIEYLYIPYMYDIYWELCAFTVDKRVNYFPHTQPNKTV